ncbi:MAG: hypothetical protein FJW91_05580 [Actinobacteria bacterium]|nr:hypothetical protein [Actinomycetota bacterium]
MESLALMVAIIVAPAFYGGPIAFLLSLFRPKKMSRFRRWSILVLAILSIISGAYLLVRFVSSGANVIGALGLSTGLGAIWQLKRNGKLIP